jgi:DNA modification methylase
MPNKKFTNKLILGDCLDVLQKIPTNSVDLIYLDPPFFSNRDYEVIWGDEGEKRSFEDRFAGGIDHYISWLKVRVRLMHSKLEDTGSIFLHCDWHANAEIKVDVLNNVFGRNNFREEIIWKRQTAKKGSQFEKRTFGTSTDTIFWYSKTNDYTFKIPKTQLKEDDLLKKFNKIDENGRKYRTDNIRLISAMARKNLIYEYKGYTPKYGWMVNREKLEQMDDEGRIYWSGTGKPYRKYFLDEYEGKEVSNLWDDIYIAAGKERIGYPTQKPEALLERIIECVTNESDVVLDPFVGGGTTVDVANRLNRKWLGIDQSVMAVKVTEMRLKKRQNELFYQPFEVEIPTHNYDELLKMGGKTAEIKIVEAFGGIPNMKGGKDYGIDGHTHYGTPIQVKKWRKPVGRATLDEFLTAIPRDDKALFEKNKKEGQICGFIIGFDFSKDLVNEVSRLAHKENKLISLKYIKDIIPYDSPPKVSLTAEELETYKYQFEAKAESEAGIDFFAWDFSNKEETFKADEMELISKESKNNTSKQTRKFSTGEHQIAVRAFYKVGLYGHDKVKIKVNRKN